MNSPASRPAPAAVNTAHRLNAALTTALFAAVLGYGLHHLPPLRDHPVVGITLVLAAAAGLSIVIGGLVARRAPYELPAIVVAPPSGPDVRPLSRPDLAFCAALHAQALPHGFFVALGSRFLRAYYGTYIDSPHAIALTATVSGHPIGHLVGVVNPAAHRSWCVRHAGITLARRGAIGLAVNPRAGYRFFGTRLTTYARSWRRGRRAHDGDERRNAQATSVLTHIAVLPGGRRVGAGRRLVADFEIEARRRGASMAVLTTLVGAAGAGDFYAGLGWRRTATRTDLDGRSVEEWSRALDGDKRR